MIEYPKFLPLPQREGYGIQSVSPIARSDLQSGRARQRRRFTSVPTVATVTWLLNDTEAQLFEGWFEHILLSGSFWFQCLLKTPLGLDDHRARFIDIYDGPNLVGVSHWRFTANVELFKRPILDAGWIITVPDYVAMADIFERAINHEWPAG